MQPRYVTRVELMDFHCQCLAPINVSSEQPKRYKALKVVILAGFLVGYGYLFGLARTAVFCARFFSLSFLVHLLYRAKTQRWQRSWLDLMVAEENGKPVAKSIGKFYYSAIVLNALLSVIISQVLPLG